MSDAKLHSEVLRIAADLPAGDATRRKLLAILKDAQFVIGPSGLEKPDDSIFLQPDTLYYLGASSDPKQVIVTKVDDDVIEYLDLPWGEKPKKRRMERWIAADLISKGSRTWAKTYARYQPDLAKNLQRMLAGKPGKKINVNKFLRDRERVTVVVSPAKAGEDCWYVAEEYGNVAGLIQDDGSMWCEVDTDMGRLDKMKQDKRLQIEQIKNASKRMAAALPIPHYSMGRSDIKKNAMIFAKAVVKAIQKWGAKGIRVDIKKAEGHFPRQWDGAYYLVLSFQRPDDAESRNVSISFNGAEDGELSGNMTFDGGGVVPVRTYDGDVEKWIRKTVLEAQPFFQ